MQGARIAGRWRDRGDRAFPGAAALAAHRGRLFLFVPVLLAVGIGIYFALPREPRAAEWGALAALAALTALGARRVPEAASPLAIGCTVVILGVLVAGWRAHQVAAPVLSFRYFGPIEGRIVGIDRSASDAIRLTLDQVVLEGVAQSRTPARVRITLQGDQPHIVPEPGLRVMSTGHLLPPPGPAAPGAFDFRRLAWFDRLGAVGYVRVPVLVAEPAAAGSRGLRVHRLRMQISAAVQDRLPGHRGGFAAAILTGDRSGIAQAQLEDLRRSNLAHLLAISGLHMGLLTGFVFGLLRLVFALIPPLALRVNTRKLAALGALAAGAFYLMLSGGNVATERAFIMVAVMLVAILLDRRAISLRSVAIAALVILLLRPEALLGAGFQMSFAATIALVVVFRWLSDARLLRTNLPRWALPVASVVICSFVAGIATAPVAAASFNRVAEYGLIANLLAVPLMGTVVMPAAVLAAILTPFGLEHLALALMGPAIDWILAVAGFVSALDGAVVPVVAPAPHVMPMLGLGALWLIIWQGPARWAGAAVMVLALLAWAQTERPALLIAPDGAVVGLMGLEGRVLSRARSGRFAAESWLQSDGDAATPEAAHARGPAGPSDPVVHLRAAGFDVVHLSGQRGIAEIDALCVAGRIIVASVTPDAPPAGPCQLFTPATLRDTGAVAMWPGPDAPRIRTARAASGLRPWSGG